MPYVPDPVTRIDQYMSYLTGNTEYYPKNPITREEQYLYYLCENGGGDRRWCYTRGYSSGGS